MYGRAFLLKKLKKVFICLLVSSLVLPICLFSSCKKQSPLSQYDLNIVYSDGEISGKLAYKFVNSYNCVFDHLLFNLHANAYSENASHPPVGANNLSKAYPYGQSFGNIEILEVTSNQESLEYEIFGEDGEFLKIFTGAIYQDKEKSVEITFKTTIPSSNLRLGVTNLSVNLGDFFPTLCYINNGAFQQISYTTFGDPYYQDVSNYTVDITVPSKFSVASSGNPAKTEITEHGTTYSYELFNGRDFAFVLSENFEIRSIKTKDLTINYYSLSDDAQEKLDLATDCINFFTKTFGKLPFQTVSIAETPFFCGGMEYSGLCIVSSNLETNDFNYSLYHELAHLWWHGGVGNDQFSCAYIDEGLCEFSTYLYLRKNKIDDANNMIENAKYVYKSFFDINSLLSGSANTTMQRNLNEFTSEYEYINIAYNKSFIMFYNYFLTVGENKALKSFKKLYKDNYLSEIDKYDLIKALGLSEHFNSYIDGKVLI